MEKGLPAALSRIFSEIADNESKRQKERIKKDAELQRKKEFYDRISGLARKYGIDAFTPVYTSVTPPVKVKIPQGTIEIQIIEQPTGGPNYSVHRSSFSIQDGERTLFHIRADGSAMNWIGEEATDEERDFVSSEILNPLEEKLAKLPKPKPSAERRIRSDALVRIRKLR